ncbi:hypothetical protein ACV3WZ_04145 [Clostridium perfringens]|uniref:hypothetical protein n=1 Tax=Clostridium perfringens TaxID=1502 RepID=UPI0013E39ACD|nr:hypothetical protein [Clostridium perfringens]NGT44985.1 hypothetical protein [Clostridium perfringens]UBK43607.1 hypothetical protein KLF34_13445 [Clostridium perfringens]HAT4165284.1 hypothetical protein [Clostridium perfringens]
MKKIYDRIIQEGSKITRKDLLKLNKENDKDYIPKDAKVVYVYSLVEKKINYPNCDGTFIYIGEAGERVDGTGARFSQHISTKANKGGNTGGNYTISRYYWNKEKIRLRIYIVDVCQDRKKIESQLILNHIKIYGAVPIAQGCTSSKYTTDKIESLNIYNEIKEIFEMKNI